MMSSWLLLSVMLLISPLKFCYSIVIERPEQFLDAHLLRNRLIALQSPTSPENRLESNQPPTIALRRDSLASAEISSTACLDTLEEEYPLIQLQNCKHVFGDTCIRDWIAAKICCPVCRKTPTNACLSSLLSNFSPPLPPAPPSSPSGSYTSPVSPTRHSFLHWERSDSHSPFSHEEGQTISKQARQSFPSETAQSTLSEGGQSRPSGTNQSPTSESLQSFSRTSLGLHNG